MQLPGTILVEYERQQHWLPEAIANNDDLLRQALSVVSPELANAEIKRSNGKVQVIPRRGTKGSAIAPLPTYDQALSTLDAMPSTIDPAIVMVVVVQQLELAHGFSIDLTQRVTPLIEQSITESQDWQTAYQFTLSNLDQANGQSHIPIGF